MYRKAIEVIQLRMDYRSRLAKKFTSALEKKRCKLKHEAWFLISFLLN